MHFFTNLTALLLASNATFGNAASLCPKNIAEAGGGLPTGSPPSIVSVNAIKELQIRLFFGNLEVAFFREGLNNVTTWGSQEFPNNTINVVTKVLAQKEVHLARLVDLLENYDVKPVSPCSYIFSVNSTREFISLAERITAVGVATTIGVIEQISATDPLLIKSLSSTLAVESRHNAALRHVMGQAPHPVPFDTAIDPIWAYNIAYSFIVPGSCPLEVPLPILPKLDESRMAYNTENSAQGTSMEQQREFTWDSNQIPFVVETGKPLLVGWVNQLNVPVYSTLNITARGKGIASVPPGLNGTTFAVLTVQTPDTILDLAFGTMAGPVVILDIAS